MAESTPEAEFTKLIGLFWAAIAVSGCVLVFASIGVGLSLVTDGIIATVSRWALVLSSLALVYLPIRLRLLYQERAAVIEVLTMATESILGPDDRKRIPSGTSSSDQDVGDRLDDSDDP